MTRYIYRVDGADFTSLAAAKKAAAKLARGGQVADVWKLILHVRSDESTFTTTLGRIHTSFPRTSAKSA